MKRYIFLFGLILLLLVGGPAAAQGDNPGLPVLDTTTWQARYWNNTTLSGEPVLTRREGIPAYASTWNSFAPGVNPDNFSARYEGYINVSEGGYRFQVTVDDGAKLSVDGRLIINKWIDEAVTTYIADIFLTTGHHYVVLDYYDKVQLAQLQLSWGPVPSTPITGPWLAHFWNNSTLAGDPLVTMSLSEVNFDWALGAPAVGIQPDNFSARFTRTINVPEGTYRFYVTADDGVRLYVAGQLLINQWRAQPVRTHTADLYLPPNTAIDLRMEYFEATGVAVAKVRWQKIGTPTPITPPPTSEVVVEENSVGFVTGGSPTGFRVANEGSGGRLLWTRNNQIEQPNYNWARWYPTLHAGRYEVFVYIPNRYTTTTNAIYWVAHRYGLTSVRIDQNGYVDRWLSLGTYEFQGTRADYVSLNDITGEPALSRLIAFDAIKWVPR